jgi:hypothetical protein
MQSTGLKVATATAEMLVHSARAALDKYGDAAGRPTCRVRRAASGNRADR